MNDTHQANDLKAVILDIDGTLVLSNEAHARAFADAAATLGLPADLNHIRRLIGMGGDKLIPEAFGVDAESETGKTLSKAKSTIFVAYYLPRLQPAPGSRALLQRFRNDGLHLVVATSADKDDVSPLLERAEVNDLIHETASSDDADASKPDPDILNAALKKIGTSAQQAVMLGDTPYDVEAARRAGVRIIAVRCGGWPDHEAHSGNGVHGG